MTRLSANFTEKELLVSASHPELVPLSLPVKYGKNARRLVGNILQPTRDAWTKALKVLSCYRSPELNEAVGGSDSSQHLRAEAADITTDGVRELFIKLLTGEIRVPVGQVIYYPKQNFIHIALPSVKYPGATFFISKTSKKYTRVRYVADVNRLDPVGGDED